MENEMTLFNSNDVMLQTMFNTQLFEQAQRAGKLFSESGLVPQSFNKNPAACFIGLQLASQLKINPLMLFQHIYQVNGKLGIEAQIAIGIANKSGVFKGPIKYEFKGEGKTRSCTARAILSNSEEEVTMTVDWETVEKEGWHKKTGSKWNTMPDLMFRYRSAMWLIRAYAPEVILGLSSSEELVDTMINVTPKRAKTIDEAIAEKNKTCLPTGKKEEVAQTEPEFVEAIPTIDIEEHAGYAKPQVMPNVVETVAVKVNPTQSRLSADMSRLSADRSRLSADRNLTETPTVTATASIPTANTTAEKTSNGAKDVSENTATSNQTLTTGSKQELEKLNIKPQMLTVYSMKILKRNAKLENMTEEEASKILDYLKGIKK